ncbi:PL29 family lyase N-terminal domain-containing protein [Bacteroides togonis]|uniref:PL29 family lyase N-terminal domain-containing protein n=1 Tax=Bacteroides togonis TaxID=1917883 RepID=UPI00094B2513|nr:PL29 family lyase N-terminal domain-containing protein [Bacteroides togonis]
MYKRTFMQTLAAVAMMLLPAACADDYDDSALWDKVNDHEERLAALEKWQEQTNQSIAAMQELLNTTDMITGVSAVSEGGQTVGYTITFLHSDPITIYNGAKGEDGADGADGQTPQIGLAQAEDGNWYWTLNGELLTDAQGNPIRANGLDGADGEDGEDGATGPEGPQGNDGTSAPTPQILLGSNIPASGTVQTDSGTTIADAWYLSVDGGATWYRVSGKDGTNGDTWFAEAPKKEGNYYVFTLANDGGSFKVAAYQPFCILAKGETLESFDNATVPVNEATTLYLSIDEGIEYSSIVAQATPVDADAVLTRADGSDWSAKVAKSGEDITVTVTPPTEAGYALLDVSLLLTDGGKLTASRLLTKGYSYDNNTYTVYTADGLKAWAEAAQSNLSLNCILAADITLPTVAEGENNWTPIGTNGYSKRYTGTFDGGGHTITGLTINQSGTDHVGLFGCIGGRGTVKNLTLENVNITGHDNVGGVVGSTDDYLNIVTGCTVSGTVSGNSNVGGVVGYNNSSVSGCTASGDVTGMGNNVGGVVGYNNSSVTACYHASGSVSGANFVGGLVGYTDLMTACYNASGDVTSKGDFVGSVAGYNSSIITACYWSNYDGNGIGINDGTGTPTKVDGTTVTWQTAVEAMNAALQYSEWRYELTGALPTLKKQ